MRNTKPSRKTAKPDCGTVRNEITYAILPQAIPLTETLEAIREVIENLPPKDNERGAVEKMLQANAILRNAPWPPPFDQTIHRLQLGDARELNWLAPESIHLVVTSPPYWTLKQYEPANDSQLGAIEDYESFLAELDKVWAGCVRALAPGGRICCVIGDVCMPRKKAGRHFVMPLHADIQVRARGFGLDVLTPILWQKIANGVTEAEGNGAGFYGKPYQPGAIIKNDVEYILFLRKGGEYRSPSPLQRALSMLNKTEMQAWLRSFWTDIKGESTRKGHPAPYPVPLAERLIKMFSFAGDTVLDPFCGTGTTAIAAMNCGRNSVSIEIEQKYLAMAHQRLREEAFVRPAAGALRANIIVNGNT
jgi:modification methylase